MSKCLLTASLLNSWYYLVDHGGDMNEFVKTLRREPLEQTEVMQLGNEFETWAIENVKELHGGVYQAALYSEIPGFLLYGKLDVLKAGTIYDIKRTSSYEVGKFYGFPQTSMYFALVPEATRFTYIIGCNHQLYRETYTREETAPIQQIAKQFASWLTINNLMNIYADNWKARD